MTSVSWNRNLRIRDVLLLLTALSNFTSCLAAAAPLVNVTYIGGGQCTSVTSLVLVDCAQGAILTVSGENVGEVSITVGGVSCRPAGPGFSDYFYQCILPSLENYSPGLGYDLVVSQKSEVVATLPGAIAFKQQPSIASITSEFCPVGFTAVSGRPYNLQCDPGSVLTIIGRFFSPSAALSVILTGPYRAGVSQQPEAQCGSVQLLSNSSLTCVLPTFAAAYGTYAIIEVFENATTYSNPLTAWVYRDPVLDPVLYNVTGCADFDAGARGAVGCTTGTTITLTGVNFNNRSSLSVNIYSFEAAVTFACLNSTVLSATTITCTLPYISGETEGGEDVFPVSVSIGSRSSNWLVAVSYSRFLTSPSTSDLVPAFYRTAFIVCLVLMVASTLGLVAVLVITPHKKAKRGIKAPMTERSSDADPSEMGPVNAAGVELL